MYVKNGSKDLKRYPQISRRVRDTLARLYNFFAIEPKMGSKFLKVELWYPLLTAVSYTAML